MACLLVLMLAWFFADTWYRPVTFGYRDAANYYYPTFFWQSKEWGQNRVPLWNSLDSTGTPSLADATSSVLYPVKLIFALPIPFFLRYNFYVAIHFVLTAATMYWTARQWQASRWGAVLASLAYTFGGFVLFQYCNVVFLVGAAWLPLGMVSVKRLTFQLSMRATVHLGIVLALCTLGGDPQTAYHLLLVGLVCQVSVRFKSRLSRAHDTRRRVVGALLLLAVAAGVGFTLAAVQILPSMQWTRHSARRLHEHPRNVYEAAALLSASVASHATAGDTGNVMRQGLLATPVRQTHHRQIYRYSSGPWRLAEFVWPNVHGQSFPVNRRWISALPAEGRTWTPSIYMGLLPLLLACRGMYFRRGPQRARTLSWLAVFSLLAAMGWYGVGWCVNEILWGLTTAGVPTGVTDESPISPPLGGVYWLLVTLLPGYAYFRYPSKWLVFAVFALALLAGLQWNRIVRRKPRKLVVPLVGIGTFSTVLISILFLARHPFMQWIGQAPPDPVYGPVDPTGALGDALLACGHTLVVVGILLMATFVRPAKPRAILFLSVTAVEIALANAWMIQTVPVELLHRTPDIVEVLRDRPDLPIDAIRLDRNAYELPEKWTASSDVERLREVVQWEYETLFPKHHLLSGLPLRESTSTLTAADRSIAAAWRRHDSDPLMDGIYNLFRIEPRVWLVGDVERLRPIDKATLAGLLAQTRSAYSSNSAVRDLRVSAAVETNDTMPAVVALPNGRCRIVRDESTRLKIAVTNGEPALLVVNDYYYPGWTATIQTAGSSQRSAKIYRVNRVMRGVFLPAGEHQLEMTYRPAMFRVGAWISFFAWIAVVGVGAASCYAAQLF
jgi:hypothetical protein